MKYKIYISPEDRASNVYASSALWNGLTTNEKEQMGRCADYMERGLLRCGSCEVINAQYGNMYDRVNESNYWPSDMHVAPHPNGFNGKAAGTRVHCYPSDRSRRIGKLLPDGRFNFHVPGFGGTGNQLFHRRVVALHRLLVQGVSQFLAFHMNSFYKAVRSGVPDSRLPEKQTVFPVEHLEVIHTEAVILHRCQTDQLALRRTQQPHIHL